MSEKIVFYYRDDKVDTVDGIDVYEAWPIRENASDKSHLNAKTWAKQEFYYYHQTPTPKNVNSLTVDNEFSDVRVYGDISERGQSAKIPKALVYNKEKNIYLLIDFRSDALVETVTEGTISKDKIKNKMVITYKAGGNYYLVPRNGSSHKEYLDKLSKTGKNSKSKKGGWTQRVEVGKVYQGPFNSIVTYLGAFNCVQDDENGNSVSDINYQGKKVHLYLELEKIPGTNRYQSRNAYRSDAPVVNAVINKSKVKEIPNATFDLDTIDDNFVTQYGTKGCYGHMLDLHVDRVNHEIKYLENDRLKRQSCYGGNQNHALDSIHNILKGITRGKL